MAARRRAVAKQAIKRYASEAVRWKWILVMISRVCHRED
jgi:hypothetical protein